MSTPTTPQHPDGTADHEPPRWLSAEEREGWLFISSIIFNLTRRLENQLQNEAGISFVEYMVLAMLSESDDLSLTMTELAITTNTLPARLSRVVARLERTATCAAPSARKIAASVSATSYRPAKEGTGSSPRPRRGGTPPDFRPPYPPTGHTTCRDRRSCPGQHPLKRHLHRRLKTWRVPRKLNATGSTFKPIHSSRQNEHAPTEPDINSRSEGGVHLFNGTPGSNPHPSDTPERIPHSTTTGLHAGSPHRDST